MRFYQFEYKLRQAHHADEMTQAPVTREWFGSERDAVVRRLELFKAGKLLGKKKDNEIWPVDIETSKPGLLTFLRKECA